MIIKKIDMHICKSFLKYFMLSLVAFLNIFLLSQIFRIVKLISEGTITLNESLVYILALIPRIIVDITPLSVLLGGLISMNVMAGNLEIISLKTSGISFKRIIVGPVILSFLISLGVYYISAKTAPKYFNVTKILRDGESELPTLKENVFLRGNGNNIYHMDLIDTKSGTGKNVMLISLNEEFNKIEKIVTAERAKFDTKQEKWILENATITDSVNRDSVNVAVYSDDNFNEAPEKFITLEKDPRTLSNSELKKVMKDIKAVGGETKNYLQQIAKRYSYPFASLVVSLIGLALGSRYVRGASALSIGISVALGYGYYLIRGVFEALSKNGYIDPFISGWLPNILFLILGIYFLNEAEY